MNKYNRNEIKTGKDVLGVIDGDILRIIKTSDNHYVRKYKGYGVSVSTLDQAENKGASILELQAPDGEKFILPTCDFRAAGIPDNLGAGYQLFLSVKWLRYYTKQHEESKQNKYMPEQMTMFE